MENTKNTVCPIPQMDENVKTFFDNYLKKYRTLPIAEKNEFVNPYPVKISLYFEANSEAEAKEVISRLFDLVDTEQELAEIIEYACEAYFQLLVNPLFEKYPKKFQHIYDNFIAILSFCVMLRERLDKIEEDMCIAYNIRFVNSFSENIFSPQGDTRTGVF